LVGELAPNKPGDKGDNEGGWKNHYHNPFFHINVATQIIKTNTKPG
jgi:hypothetical protein